MRTEICIDCICNHCINNAEDYADGMCRECECCKENGPLEEAQRCRDYKSTEDTKMGKWVIEMAYGLNITVENVEADSREAAEKRAREMVSENIEEYADLNDLEFEIVTYASQKK